jgi:ABC-type glutathione transport system ATPase component
MIINIRNKIEESKSYASQRTLGLYNVGVKDATRFYLDVDVPIEDRQWQIGVVVGPSGSGKTSIARGLEEHGWQEWRADDWGNDPVIDVLNRGGSYAKATAALAAVGLGSVPSWIRPRGVLSNGEGFRADLAFLLLDDVKDVYIDEFTSILDRQVAKIGAGAFARAWRRQEGRRVILITPHYDVLDWIEPDWWIDTQDGLDEFAEDRGVVFARKGTFQEAVDQARYPGDEVARIQC